MISITLWKLIYYDNLWYLLPYASERNYDLRRWFRYKKRHTSQRVFGISRATSMDQQKDHSTSIHRGSRWPATRAPSSWSLVEAIKAEIHGEFSAWSIINHHETDRSMWKFTRAYPLLAMEWNGMKNMLSLGGMNMYESWTATLIMKKRWNSRDLEPWTLGFDLNAWR